MPKGRAITRWVGASFALVLAAAVAGFFVFASFATRPLPRLSVSADAIVVLTGGPRRIRAAAELLRERRGTRLLVSGVNRVTTARDLRRLTALDDRMFRCCVDIGYMARNTVENARETRHWQRQHNFTSLIVVTSRFHMPRTLAELRGQLPDVELKPFPVAPLSPADAPWWQDVGVARVLVSEYLKFLPAFGRYAWKEFVMQNGAEEPSVPVAQNGPFSAQMDRN